MGEIREVRSEQISGDNGVKDLNSDICTLLDSLAGTCFMLLLLLYTEQVMEHNDLEQINDADESIK